MINSHGSYIVSWVLLILDELENSDEDTILLLGNRCFVNRKLYTFTDRDRSMFLKLISRVNGVNVITSWVDVIRMVVDDRLSLLNDSDSYWTYKDNGWTYTDDGVVWCVSVLLECSDKVEGDCVLCFDVPKDEVSRVMLDGVAEFVG